MSIASVIHVHFTSTVRSFSPLAPILAPLPNFNRKFWLHLRCNGLCLCLSKKFIRFCFRHVFLASVANALTHRSSVKCFISNNCLSTNENCKCEKKIITELSKFYCCFMLYFSDGASFNHSVFDFEFNDFLIVEDYDQRFYCC